MASKPSRMDLVAWSITSEWFKWASLCALVAQNTGFVITMRLSRAAHSDKYASTVAVLIIEALKLLCAFFLFAKELDRGLVYTLRERGAELNYRIARLRRID